MSTTETNGVRAELSVEDPAGCPVASASAESGTSVRGVSWTGRENGVVTEQFALGDEGDVEFARELFDDAGGTVYQFDRDPDADCVCESVEQLSCPVTDVRAEDGVLYLTLYFSDVDRLREVITHLRRQYDGVSVRYLAHDGGGDHESLVPVDLARLTDRQREALETAYEMGYFEYPRGANASEVAEEMDIGPSTLIEHLTAAQSKLLEDLIDDRTDDTARS